MTTQEEMREAVARIAEPESWNRRETFLAQAKIYRDATPSEGDFKTFAQERERSAAFTVAPSLAKADAILAIVSKLPAVGELVKAATDLLAIRASIIGGFRVDVQEEASRRLDRLASALATTSGKEP